MLVLATSPVRRLLKANRQPGNFQRFLLTGRAREYPGRVALPWAGSNLREQWPGAARP